MTAMLMFLFLSTVYAEEPVVVPVVAPVVAESPVVSPAPEAAVAVPVEGAPVEGAPVVPVEGAPVVPAIEIPATDAEALADGAESISLLQAGEWGAGIVLLLGVLAFVLNKFLRKKAPVA